MLKVFNIQNLADIGLRVHQVNGSLPKTMTFLVANVASILTVWTAVRRFKVIVWIAVGG